jgi:uncharacterized membrane protein YdjX (TVP38/TMEM64 family)
VLGTVLFVPGALFGLAGGVLYGPVWGTPVRRWGQLLPFWWAATWRRTGCGSAGARLERLIKGVEAEGWRFVALTRLVPLIPFNMLNYALGLDPRRFLHADLADMHDPGRRCHAPGGVRLGD